MKTTTKNCLNKIREHIRDIPDFPEPGIIFRDITPVLGDAEVFKLTVDLFADRLKQQSIDKIVAVEARGFILGAAIAYALKIGFVPIRKPGKLPRETFSEDYSLEYGKNTLQIHTDSFAKGERIAIIDDVLATGGTAAATALLVKRLGGIVVESGFLLELKALNGREKLAGLEVYSAIEY